MLPREIQDKVKLAAVPPVFTEYDVYCKIRRAKKPNSKTPSDIPKKLLVEFSPELAFSLKLIINKVFSSGEWPEHWKKEHVIPIIKKDPPKLKDDLMPIFLTPFFSKVCEHFVVEHLMKYISSKLDFRQYGGTRGNSITHYLIEFVNFILTTQDRPGKLAVLACYVDFQKAFNRQNHYILIKKLHNLGVPGWLLKIVISFLMNRTMIVRYNGEESSSKSLPGGGPQGTLLALLLFLILINDTGFDDQFINLGDVLSSRKHIKAANELHLKFVDDLTLAEAINLTDDLVEIPETEMNLPTNYHDRTGHALPSEKSKLYEQLIKTEKYANEHEMKINYKKTKVMLFNPCTSLDFTPKIELSGQSLQLVEETRLLGLIVSNDLKWSSNTDHIVKKAYKRLWILRRLKNLGAKTEVYTKQIRCTLELAVPVWNSSLTIKESNLIERVQRCALHIILGRIYLSYQKALSMLSLQSLRARRSNLCLKFALKAEKSTKFQTWFKPNPKHGKTRTKQAKYLPVYANNNRLQNSPIAYLTDLLNKHYMTHP